MCRHVPVRPNRSLLFAAKQNKSNGASRQEARRFDCSRGFNHQRRITAVIERASSQFPRIEMGGQNYDLVRLFPSANFADDIFLLYWPANSVRHAEPRTNLAGMCR